MVKERSNERWKQLRLPLRVARKTDVEMIEDDPLAYLRKVAGRKSKIYSNGILTIMVFKDTEGIADEDDACVDIWEDTSNGIRFREGYILQRFAVNVGLAEGYDNLLTGLKGAPTGVTIDQATNLAILYAQVFTVATFVKNFIDDLPKK
jgi:hypothetical protein